MKATILFFTLGLGLGLTTTGLIHADDTTAKGDSKPAATQQVQKAQASLGIRVSSLPPVLASHLPEAIVQGRGVLVSEVTEGSAADEAGLKQNDVLTRYDDQDLYSPEQLVKRVRNDQPGTAVELEYVRGGKLQTVKVTLGQSQAPQPGLKNWPGFKGPLEAPLGGFRSRFFAPYGQDFPFGSGFSTEQQDASGEATEWTYFSSMSVSKGPDGKYTAKIKFQGENKETLEREYVGTRQEVRELVEADDQLPDSQKRKLLRSLDDRAPLTVPGFEFPKIPSWGRELFNWHKS